MSKQLSISAAFSVFAMAAFALYATAGQGPLALRGETAAGAPIEIEAPALSLQQPELPALPFLSN